MKNYIIVAVIIVLIIAGVVWYKAKTPATVTDIDVATTTETVSAETMTVETVETVETAGETPVATTTGTPVVE